MVAHMVSRCQQFKLIHSIAGAGQDMGGGIMAIKTESASRLIYWDGKRLRWYQQGD